MPLHRTQPAVAVPPDAQLGATPEHEALRPFIGAWRVEGRQLETAIGPAADIHGIERFEWLSGGHFLVHNFHAQVGDGKAAYLGIIGHDPKEHVYPIRTFHDDGKVSEGTMRDGSGIWIMNGEWNVRGQLYRVRCAVVFVDPRVRTCMWEYAVDGAWRAFWELRAVTLTPNA